MRSSKSPKTGSRGRPALSEKEMAATRRHIIECASRLFQQEGYDGVSMRRLASEAGCTVMTLYRYFERKIDILRELWKEVFDELFDQLELIAEENDNAVLRLNAIALGYVNYWLDKREHYFLVFMSSGVSQTDVSIFVGNEGVIERFGLIYDSVAKALDGKTDDHVINLKAQLLLCSLNGIAHNLITISAYPWAEPDALVKAAISGAVKA